jgi:Probable taurine catabolism dioxygenase
MCIEGFEKEESDKLLNKLYSHMIQEKYIYRHSWKKNMLVIWDNRAVMHQATGGYDGYDRLLHRITIAGEQPS